ncbi:hypothetical protein [Hyphomonas sp.]|jgi:hypothetical protein
MEQAVRLKAKALCEATRPGEISRVAFDGSPLEARMKMAGDVAAWAEVCG